jgi:hypothetical protein
MHVFVREGDVLHVRVLGGGGVASRCTACLHPPDRFAMSNAAPRVSCLPAPRRVGVRQASRCTASR